MNEQGLQQIENTNILATKKEKREAEAFRIAIIAKEMASAFWRKNHPIKK